MLSNPNKFSEKFAGCFIASLIDWFSGYNQVILDIANYDFTTIQIFLGLIRMTTLFQGATNFVAQFFKVVVKILQAHMSYQALLFIDNIGVKRVKTDYNGEEIKLGLRCYVLEHIQWLDGVSADLKCAGYIIAGAKSQFCMSGLKIVDYICDSNR